MTGTTPLLVFSRRAARLLAAWLLLSCVCAPAGFAQAPAAGVAALPLASPTAALSQYKLDLWQTEQGLPLNTVQALLQTRDGYLWVGTAGGLARFDGVHFATFDAAQAPGMASEPVFGLLHDREGNLWVGHSKGAALYRNGKFETGIASEVTGSRRVWAFAQAPDGTLWAATENGLVRRDAKTGATQRYQQAPDGLPTNRLRSLAFDPQGLLWIATTGGGLVSFDPASGRFRTLNPDNGFPHLQVRQVLADPQRGCIWAATAGGGLVRIDQGRVSRVYGVTDGLPSDHLTALALDAQGTLWIGSWGAGISRMDPDGGGTGIPRIGSMSTAEGLAGSQIWSLQTDREGSVWVGTWVGGLNRLRNRPFVVFGTPEGLSHDNVRAVLHARNGVGWVSTSGGGLNRIEDGRVVGTLGRKDGLPTDEISTLHEDREGALWIGSYTAGLARLAPDGRGLAVFGLAEGLPNAEIRAILEDRQGRLWVGTRGGLARLDAVTGRFTPVLDPGLPAEGVAAILEDRQGTLWFGTTGQGLVRYRDGRFTTLTKADGLVSTWIMALYEDAAGTLWIGSNGEGMNRLDGKTGKLVGIRPRDGLWDGLAQIILEDGQGYLWMSCNRGFFRVARAELDAFAEGRATRVNATGFGPGDALRGTTFAGGLQAAGARDAAGRLWLPSANGLVIVDPRHLPGAGQAPGVRLESVTVSGAPQPPEEAVLLPPGAVPLAIRYTAMTLLYADKARFRYRMDGITRDWVDAGSSREASFPALPHGHYRFRVAASTDGLHWQEAERPLAITVQPQLWQTPWFIALLALGGLAGFAGLVRLRTRALQARQAEMERLVAQRTEELRQANAHLSRLSFADALTGLANRRRFDAALEEEWRRARRAHGPLALVIADIDGFKRYNDVLGHQDGDRCLIAVAGVFAGSVCRAGDLAARYGGEEFIVLLPGADQAAALAVAEQIRAACEALALPHPDSPTGKVVTLSLGVAACLPASDARASVEALIAAADAALYRAKQTGRNRVCG